MRSTRTWFAPRWIACAVVVVMHGSAGWVLMNASRRLAESDDSDRAIQVVFIDRAPPRAASERVAHPARRARAPLSTPLHSLHIPVASEPPTPARAQMLEGSDAARAETKAEDPVDSGNPSATFIDQGRRLIGAGNEARFTRNLFARPTTDPAPPTRIAVRMRNPITPADVLGAIGQLVGGPGYVADPCPQIRRNIAGRLAYGADDPLLRAEMERERMCKGSRD